MAIIFCVAVPEFDNTAAYDDFTIDYELWKKKSGQFWQIEFLNLNE